MKLLLLLLLIACSSCGVRTGSEKVRAPNIILIMTDDQGYGDVGYNGNRFIRTPVLDSLARLAVSIDPFYVSPVCAPTRSSLMTGRYHLRTGVYDTYNGGAMMAQEEITVAEVLAENGYHTAMIGKWHLGDTYPMRPMDQGFHYSLAHKGGGIGQPGDDMGNFLRGDSAYFDPWLWENGVRTRRYGYCSDIFTDEAIGFLQGHVWNSGRDPFFLYLAYNAPHTPLQLPEQEYSFYRDLRYGPEDFPSAGSGMMEMDEKDMEDARKIYGMVTNLDRNIGRILVTLKELGMEENTLVVFLTDNGPQQRRYNAGLNGRKGSVLEGGIRVPCLFYWPGTLEGNRMINYPSAHIDMMPTLLEFAGIEPPANINGISLVPFLQGDGVVPAERSLHFVWSRGFPERYTNMAVRRGVYKLVGNNVTEDTAELRLYDLSKDPNETNDVGPSNPLIKLDLTADLDNWFDQVMASPHLVEGPRIFVGSERENPVILGRNDWKGPMATRWASQTAFGYWDVYLVSSGPYRVKMKFQHPLPSSGTAVIRAGTRQYRQSQKDSENSEIVFNHVNLNPGNHAFEGWYRSGGTIYSPVCIEIELI